MPRGISIGLARSSLRPRSLFSAGADTGGIGVTGGPLGSCAANSRCQEPVKIGF